MCVYKSKIESKKNSAPPTNRIIIVGIPSENDEVHLPTNLQLV